MRSSFSSPLPSFARRVTFLIFLFTLLLSSIFFFFSLASSSFVSPLSLALSILTIPQYFFFLFSVGGQSLVVDIVIPKYLAPGNGDVSIYWKVVLRNILKLLALQFGMYCFNFKESSRLHTLITLGSFCYHTLFLLSGSEWPFSSDSRRYY